ncbi:hypothetical protein KY284_001460 [Solanum tuberosum]|nr:hypothetical protein KY284_001460 [Solanum tuberosum]
MVEKVKEKLVQALESLELLALVVVGFLEFSREEARVFWHCWNLKLWHIAGSSGFGIVGISSFGKVGNTGLDRIEYLIFHFPEKREVLDSQYTANVNTILQEMKKKKSILKE